VDIERERKRLHGREEAFLQIRTHQCGCNLRAPGRAAQPFLAQLGVSIKKCGQSKFRRIVRQPFDVDLNDIPLRDAIHDFAKVVFEAPHHDLLETFRIADFDASAETLRVENL
jgi:hypothetical protein